MLPSRSVKTVLRRRDRCIEPFPRGPRRCHRGRKRDQREDHPNDRTPDQAPLLLSLAAVTTPKRVAAPVADRVAGRPAQNRREIRTVAVLRVRRGERGRWLPRRSRCHPKVQHGYRRLSCVLAGTCNAPHMTRRGRGLPALRRIGRRGVCHFQVSMSFKNIPTRIWFLCNVSTAHKQCSYLSLTEK